MIFKDPATMNNSVFTAVDVRVSVTASVIHAV